MGDGVWLGDWEMQIFGYEITVKRYAAVPFFGA